MTACRERSTVFGVRKWTYLTHAMPAATAAATTIGPHDGPGRVEDPHGRRVRLHPGDLVIGAHGNRYVTDFYEGYVPAGPRTHLRTALLACGRRTLRRREQPKPDGIDSHA
jgi:hypothetical protein